MSKKDEEVKPDASSFFLPKPLNGVTKERRCLSLYFRLERDMQSLLDFFKARGLTAEEICSFMEHLLNKKIETNELKSYGQVKELYDEHRK